MPAPCPGDPIGSNGDVAPIQGEPVRDRKLLAEPRETMEETHELQGWMRERARACL
jgi:hypothetical protein